MKPSAKPVSSVKPASDPPSDMEISERIFRTLFRTTSLIRQIMGPFFEGYGISTAQWVVLRILFEREQEAAEPIRLVDLSNCLAIRQPSLTAVMNKLLAAGLTERVATAGERRGRRIRLTAQGREMIEQISTVHRERLHSLLCAWDQDEKQQIFGLLGKFWNHRELINRSADGSDMQRNHSGKKTT